MKLQLPLGVYVPGRTVIHRMPAGWKFVILIAFIIVVGFCATGPVAASIALTVVAIGMAVARIPIRTALGQVLPVVPILLLLGAFQWWQNSWQLALGIVLSLLATVAAAALLTLTTPVSELMDSLERGMQPLARVGVPVERISLAMALTLRLVPLQAVAVYEVLEARKARGAGFSLAAFGTPVVIRSITRARELGEALMARGVGD